ncbi:MAG: oxidoreductase/short-chain dehydrogenase [Acidimicrobiia bacterium]|nr:MAG: oxidoreductase/short-chain dehydrogenase [Acidimicrobiia bacterium]
MVFHSTRDGRLGDQMDRVALVTAAGRGIGAATARALAEAGYRLVLLSPSGSAARLAEELGCRSVTGSVTEPADLEELVRVAIDSYGRVDAVVNNTGHPPRGELLEISDQEWNHGLDLVFLNVVRMARLVTPIMIEQGGGAFVNVSAFGAVQPDLSFPVSSSIRAGLRAFTRLYATRYGPHGIRMNDVLVGYAETYPVAESVIDAIPVGRAATVDEIAATIGFLLSPEAGSITGQGILVDGGMVRGL